jgi:hypothetical protein
VSAVSTTQVKVEVSEEILKKCQEEAKAKGIDVNKCIEEYTKKK